MRAFSQEALGGIDGGRKTNVIGVWFKRQAKQRNFFALEHPERFTNFVEKQIDALLVDLLGSLQQSEIDAYTLGQSNEGLNILGQAKTAETESRLQKLRADSGIHSYRSGNFLDVGAELITHIRQRIRKRDFQSEKRIRGVLD